MSNPQLWPNPITFYLFVTWTRSYLNNFISFCFVLFCVFSKFQINFFLSNLSFKFRLFSYSRIKMIYGPPHYALEIVISFSFSTKHSCYCLTSSQGMNRYNSYFLYQSSDNVPLVWFESFNLRKGCVANLTCYKSYYKKRFTSRLLPQKNKTK